MLTFLIEFWCVSLHLGGSAEPVPPTSYSYRKCVFKSRQKTHVYIYLFVFCVCLPSWKARALEYDDASSNDKSVTCGSTEPIAQRKNQKARTGDGSRDSCVRPWGPKTRHRYGAFAEVR